jgi:cob(I)alamin adenosyltransferase
MPRLTKIYTRRGDDGMTSLGGGQRVPKDSARVRAYGTLDELNSVIGLARAGGLSPRLSAMLPVIQNDLFTLGSDLCFLESDKALYHLAQIESRQVEQLEKWIDELTEAVGALENFVLPDGTVGAAQLHVARTVCRRAEREVLSLARTETAGPQVLPYLNRLSDLLFVMARYENHERGVAEPLWNQSIESERK